MRLEEMTTEELCETYEELNGYRWPAWLDGKPEGFDEMINYRNTLLDYLLRRPCRSDHVRPLLWIIEQLVPERELSHYHITKVLGKTEEYFERFWNIERPLWDKPMPRKERERILRLLTTKQNRSGR